MVTEFQESMKVISGHIVEVPDYAAFSARLHLADIILASSCIKRRARRKFISLLLNPDERDGIFNPMEVEYLNMLLPLRMICNISQSSASRHNKGRTNNEKINNNYGKRTHTDGRS